MIELLFYLSIFAVIFLIMINSIMVMTRSFRETSINTDIIQSSNIMDRISREIRKAESINTISANSLKLNTTNDAGTATTVEFSLSGSNIVFYDNDVLLGNLNSPNIAVTALTFTQITTTSGTAVKIFMTVVSNSYGSNRAESFYNTVVLRGSY